MDFGFFFTRVLHFYAGLGGYHELLGLSIRTFWLLHENVNRIRAELDIRAFHVSDQSQGTEGAKFKSHLVVEMGTITEVDPIASAHRDETGVARLKKMVDQGKRKQK